MSETQVGVIVHMDVWFFIGLGVNIAWSLMTHHPKPLMAEWCFMLGGALSYLARRIDDGRRDDK